MGAGSAETSGFGRVGAVSAGLSLQPAVSASAAMVKSGVAFDTVRPSKCAATEWVRRPIVVVDAWDSPANQATPRECDGRSCVRSFAPWREGTDATPDFLG